MADMRQSKGHAIMISLPYQGHLNPFVNLALKLASKGFSITFAHLEFLHHKLSKAHHGNNTQVDFFSKARELGLDISYTTISDGLPVEYDRDLHFEEYWRIIIHDFPDRVDEFVGKIIQSSGPVHFLVADTVYAWPPTIADKYNLVNVSLWTTPAMEFSLCYHWDLLREKGHFPCKDEIEEEINYVPGVASINTRDLMTFLKASEASSVVGEALLTAFTSVKKADFILHNTVHELESEAISALNKDQPNYAVGPLNCNNILAKEIVNWSLWSESEDCIPWLHSKPHGSVLYVSFGSSVHPDKQLLEEIAYGLLLSGVNFIWVIQASIHCSGDTDVLLKGYKDEIKDKGLIVSWCNQIKVLSNPAIGGFLTHNGWNSTVESMWCGVPMICYPVVSDQITNRKLVVDYWKIGISLCDGKSVDRNEVAEKIRSFMSGDASKKLREEARKVKEIVHKAMEIEGSSEWNFDRFVEDLKKKILAKATS